MRGFFIAVVLALAVVAGALVYFRKSPNAVQQVDAALAKFNAAAQRQATEAASRVAEWTAERMQKDPVGYLQWALDECVGTSERLTAGKISLRAQRSQMERSITASGADVTGYTRQLDEAKTLYKSHKADDKWPVEFRGAMLGEQELRTKIIDTHNRLAALRELIDAHRKNEAIVDQKVGELEMELVGVEKLRNRISTELEVAKVKQTVDGLAQLSDQVTAMVSTTGSMAASPADIVTLDSLVKQKSEQTTAVDFENILGK